MYVLCDFLNKLSYYLIKSENLDNNIIRKHTRALQELGDISFPFAPKNWHKFIDKKETSEIESIFEIRHGKRDLKLHMEQLLEESKCWPVQIKKCDVIKNSLHIWLQQTTTFATVIKDVLNQQGSYGSCDLHFQNNFQIKTDVPCTDITNMTLTNLKIVLLESVLNNLLQFNKCHYENNKSVKLNIIVTSKSVKDSSKVLIVCGAVLDETRTKNVFNNASKLYEKQTVSMRLMAEHKYGIRITSKPKWQEYFAKLGEAAVTIDMLQNKPHHTTIVDINNHTLPTSKGAAFILYNCARLATLLKEFDKKVAKNIYPPLPSLDDIDCSLLIQPEEWELLYVYVLQFPLLIKTCIKDIEHGKVNPHYLVSTLSKICSVFSVYYRRIRILTEPRDHLFPLIHARIYLLKTVECVFHIILHLLNIQPVKQM